IDYLPLQAEMLYSIGFLQDRAGDPRAAETTLRRAADAAARAGDHYLYARTALGLLWVIGAKQGRFDDAAPLRTLAAQAVALAGDPADLRSQLLVDDGAVDYIHGDYARARPTLERAVAVTESLHGPDSVDLVAPLNLLAAAQADDDDHSSIELYQRALRILRATQGPNHPRVGSILGNLANSYSDLGDLDKAIAYQRQAIAIIEGAYGADAPDLGPALVGLGNSVWMLGRYDEAYQLNQRAGRLWEKAYGPEHPYVQVAQTNMAGLLRKLDRCAEALPIIDRVLTRETKRLGADHPTLAMSVEFRGGCLLDVGRLAEARPELERALRLYGSSSPGEVAMIHFDLARLRWASGERTAALAEAEQARRALLDDPADLAQRAHGVVSVSDRVAAWLKDKRP
ncbi:MAG TPA: tetratricopeptide repeat protein, partial [Kofleriaceae bacterium]|nr:tetratricopeptide repeat protein [Kofleriaceae bacterium]